MNYEIINQKKRVLGLTNQMIAEKAGITLSSMDKITSGVNQNPKLDTLQAIANVIGCTLDDFSDKKNDELPLSNEALRIARAYDNMNEKGRNAVRAVVEALEDQ